MKLILPPYRLLTTDLLQRAGLRQSKLIIRVDGETVDWNRTFPGSVIALPAYDPDTQLLEIQASFSLPGANLLFGDSGVASQDAKLGVSLMWHSRDSGVRGMSRIHEFCANDSVNNIPLEVSFQPGLLRGQVDVIPALVLRECGAVTKAGFCRMTGGVLGSLDAGGGYCISIDGEGSRFPITEFRSTDSAAPLWTLHFRWENPLEEAFSKETVEVRINTGHRDYPLLSPSEKGQIPPTMKEILTTTLVALVYRLKEDAQYWEPILGHEAEPGSVGDAVWYFINKLEWSVSSPEALVACVRATVEN